MDKDQDAHGVSSPYAFRDRTKRLSILKPQDAENKDDTDFDMTRTRNYTKRVSFANHIQIKTIDESLNDQAAGMQKGGSRGAAPQMDDSIIPYADAKEETSVNGSCLMDTMNDTTFRDFQDSVSNSSKLGVTINETINETMKVSMMTSTIEADNSISEVVQVVSVQQQMRTLSHMKENIPINKSTLSYVDQQIKPKFSNIENRVETANRNEAILKHLNVENVDKEALKAKLREELEKLKKVNACLKVYHEQKASKREEYKENILKLQAENAALKKKLQTVRINSIKENFISNVNNINEKMLEKETELQSITRSNQNLSKQNEKNTNSLDKHFVKLNKIKEAREHYENIIQYNRLFANVIKDYNAPFKLSSYTNDSVTLLYFHDLIEIEITSPNIGSTRVDNGNARGKPLRDTSTRFILRSRIKEDCEEYLKFCCKLIECGIDTKALNRKYRSSEDLPILIDHLNLTCVCAENLSNDLEYLIAKYQSVEFNTENFTIKFNMHSLTDLCFYELKLWIYPNAYYEEPLMFEIDSIEEFKTSFYKPNHQRLSKLLEDKYLENGSLKNLLEELN